MKKASLNLENIEFSYLNHKSPVEIFKNLNIKFAEGEISCILGTSGCGKSTLLDLIAGIKKPHKGRIGFDSDKGENPKIGYVFQTPALLPWYTLRKNIEVALQIRNSSSPEEVNNKIQYWLESTELLGYENLYPGQLSLGMQQRASLAVTMVTEPDIVLLDEPFGSLDSLTRERMDVLLLKIWELSKKTMIMVTHDIDEAILVGGSVILFKRRPGGIMQTWNITLPFPRDPIGSRKEEAFLKFSTEIRKHLFVTNGAAENGAVL
jgi:ABC-type nitrate/sulfonate/bicarbonate transport system ATPase subunit